MKLVNNTSKTNNVLPFLKYRNEEYQGFLDISIENMDSFSDKIFLDAVNLSRRGCLQNNDNKISTGEILEISEEDLLASEDPLVVKMVTIYRQLQTAIRALSYHSEFYKEEFASEYYR